MNNKAISVNMSFVDNDGAVEAGAHITDSNGLDINTKITGNSFEEVIENLSEDLIEQMISQYAAQQKEEEPVEDYPQITERLYAENQTLKKRVQELEKKLASQTESKTNSHKRTSRDFPFYNQDIERILKSLDLLQ